MIWLNWSHYLSNGDWLSHNYHNFGFSLQGGLPYFVDNERVFLLSKPPCVTINIFCITFWVMTLICKLASLLGGQQSWRFKCYIKQQHRRFDLCNFFPLNCYPQIFRLSSRWEFRALNNGWWFKSTIIFRMYFQVRR